MAENEKGVDVEPEEFEEPEPILDEDGNDTTDWKAEAKKGYGMAKRFQTKSKKLSEEFDAYKKANPEKPEEPEQPQDKKEFDLAEKSYLLSSGIKKGEFQLVFDEMKASGKTMDEVLESPYFKEKLEENRSKEAVPKDNKRGGGSAKDSVDYWINKGEYPPDTPENTELRRKVLKELARRDSEGSKFSPNPIV